MDESKIEEETGSAVDAGEGEGHWHPVRKLLFRFSCIYFLWYALPDFAFPGRSNDFVVAMYRIAIWVGENILKLGDELSFDPAPTSGDTTVHYVKLLVMVVASLAGSLVWTLFDRRRPHYRRLGGWLVVVCRYYLMSVMLTYGFNKVFLGQFHPLSLDRLLETYGASSPMGLLWTTMEYSRPYTLFSGLAEVIGGLLMGLRRTTTLGACIVAGVMSNVVMMNFSYDVPVKLYSSHLLLMALVLLALDSRRLLDVLVLNRPARAAVYSPHFVGRRGRIATLAVKALTIGLFLVMNVSTGLASQKFYGSDASKPPLWGIYDVETFVMDEEILPPLLTDARRWQNLIFDTRGRLSVRMMDGTIERYGFAVDGANKLSIYRDRRYSWTYERPSPERLLLAGELGGRAVSLELRARDLDDFLLVRRGFHWVNEVPLIR